MSDAPRRDFDLPAAPERVADAVDEELRFHLEQRRAQLIADGLSPAEADAEVRRRFGDVDGYRKEVARIDRRALRGQRRARFVGSLARESRRAARALWRDRGFSLVATWTLAVGIAATLAMFAVLDSVVLRPLPYADADRLVAVLHPATVPGNGERRWGVSPGGYVHLREHARSIRQLGIYRNFSMTVLSGGDAELARIAMATHSVFDALRARASLGRLYAGSDDAPGAAPVAVISAEYHRDRFGSDPAIVGKLLETAGGSYEIVGVAAPGLTLPMPGPFADASDLTGFGVDVWLPMQVNPAGPFWNTHPNVGIARLADGVTADEANRELAALLQRFPEWMPQAYSPGFISSYNFRIAAIPLRDAVLGAQVPRVLWLLFGTVLLVLGAAAANVGNLFLARLEMRRRESALRTALGANRLQMTAHFLAEALLIAGAAATLGLVLAQLAVRALPLIAPRDIPRMHEVALGGTALAVLAGIVVVLTLAFAIVPLLRRELDVAALRDGSRSVSASPRQRAARHALVVAQVAATMVLLTGAATMLRYADEIRGVEPGFDAAGTLAFEVSLPFTAYDTRERALDFYRQLDARLKALPGVVAVGGGSVPLQDFGTGCSVVFREARPYDVGEQTPCVSTPVVLPGYFDALGIAVRGERPSWRDVDARTQAVVVTRALADRLWPGEDPTGRGIGSNGPDAEAWYRVVGVIESLRAEALSAPPTEAVFYAATGLEPNVRSGAINDLSILVRAATDDPLALLPAVRATVKELDPRVPVVAPRTLQQVVDRSLARTDFLLGLIGVAAAIAFVLSAVGTYGVIAYLVTQRRGEIGVRIALGAPAASVVRLVVGQSLRMALTGIAVGALGAFYASRLLQGLVVGAGGAGPLLIVGIGLALLTVAVLASLGPARRALGVQPVEAMRS